MSQRPPPAKVTDVYAAGQFRVEGKLNACYWRNGVKVPLAKADGIETSWSRAIAISGGHVYNAGVEISTNRKACLWIDDKPEITLEEGKSFASSIIARGDYLYIGGYCNVSSRDTACVWKVKASDTTDITRIDIAADPAYTDDTVSGICIEDGKLYMSVSRHSTAGYTAALWVYDESLNKHKVDNVGAADKSRATDITVKDGVTYITGIENQKACFWIGKVVTGLSDVISDASGIAIKDGSVYVGGNTRQDGKQYLCYWKNNAAGCNLVSAGVTSQMISSAFAMDGDDIYVGGYYKPDGFTNFSGLICKNGEVLLDINEDGSVLYDIVVVTR